MLALGGPALLALSRPSQVSQGLSFKKMYELISQIDPRVMQRALPSS